MNDYIFRGFAVPAYLVSSLQAYAEYHIPVGSFLQAVLCNNFMEACTSADDHNCRNLPAFAAYVYNEMPSACHGSAEAYNKWIAKVQPVNGAA